MRPVAGVLALAAAAMLVLAFATDGGKDGTTARPALTREVAAAGTPEPAGLRVWAAQGCGSCHSLAAAQSDGKLAPDLDQTLPGATRSYVLRSIVQPGADATAGWDAGMMPDDFVQRIDGKDLDALVDYLMATAAAD